MTLLRRRQLPLELVPAFDAFRVVLEIVERAKEEVLLAVPAPRVPGRPLAEALLAFGESLDEIEAHMSGWRVPSVEQAWLDCSAGLTEAGTEAERLRIAAPDLGFEDLLGAIGDLLAPLDAFEAAIERFLELRR
jgi:hypothetical protein